MRWRDILWPWGALREARAERDSAQFSADLANRAAADFERFFEAQVVVAASLRAELERLKRAPKRDAKTGRFV